MLKLTFQDKKRMYELSFDLDYGNWICETLEKIDIYQTKNFSFQDIKLDFQEKGLIDFELFWHSKPMIELRDIGLSIF